MGASTLPRSECSPAGLRRDRSRDAGHRRTFDPGRVIRSEPEFGAKGHHCEADGFASPARWGTAEGCGAWPIQTRQEHASQRLAWGAASSFRCPSGNCHPNLRQGRRRRQIFADGKAAAEFSGEADIQSSLEQHISEAQNPRNCLQVEKVEIEFRSDFLGAAFWRSIPLELAQPFSIIPKQPRPYLASAMPPCSCCQLIRQSPKSRSNTYAT